MNKPMHLDLPVGLAQQVLEKRYRREGYIVILVALVGVLLAGCCRLVSDTVGSALGADIHPAPVCVLGLITVVWSAIMLGMHYLRSPEDILREDEGKWGKRAWYCGGR